MLPQPPPKRMGKKEKKKKKKTNSPLHPSRPSPKLPKISVVDKSLNEEEAFELRSQVEEICQYWSVCLKSYQFKMLNFTKCYAVFCL